MSLKVPIKLIQGPKPVISGFNRKRVSGEQHVTLELSGCGKVGLVTIAWVWVGWGTVGSVYILLLYVFDGLHSFHKNQ